MARTCVRTLAEHPGGGESARGSLVWTGGTCGAGGMTVAEEGAGAWKHCPQCHVLIAGSATHCPHCGFAFPLPPKAPFWTPRNSFLAGLAGLLTGALLLWFVSILRRPAEPVSPEPWEVARQGVR